GSLAVDGLAGKMYWTDVTDSTIRRANLDGSSIQDLLNLGIENQPNAIALEPTGRKMYWTEIDFSTSGLNALDKIRRANLDGSGVETLVSGRRHSFGLAVDGAGGKMYWFDASTIRRANLDGSGIEHLVDSALSYDIALLIGSPGATPTPVP